MSSKDPSINLPNEYSSYGGDGTDHSDDPVQIRKPHLKALIRSDNIAELIDEQDLHVISQQSIKEYQLDLADASRARKIKKWQRGIQIVRQDDSIKTFPWRGCSNVKFPMITIAAIQFSARALPSLITSDGVVRKRVLGRQAPTSQINASYNQGSQPTANSQQPYQSQPPTPGMPPSSSDQSPVQGIPSPTPPTQSMPMQPQPQDMQAMLAQLQQLGSGADQRSKDQRAQDGCDYLNYQFTCQMSEWVPDTERLLLQLSYYGSMFRKIWYSHHRRRLCSKIMTPIELVLPSMTSCIEEATRITEIYELTPNEIQSYVRGGYFLDIDYRINQHSEDHEQPLQFIDQHRWEDLDGDGYKEPYIVTICLDALPDRSDLDGRGIDQLPTAGRVVRVIAEYDEDCVIYSTATKRVEYIHRFCQYVEYTFIPSLDSTTYGTGFFDIALPLNKSINSILNQLIDSGTLANSNTGFISNDLRMSRQDIKPKIGQYTAVNARGVDIKNGIVPMEYAGPSPVLFQLLQFLIEAGREITNIKDILSESKATNIPATTTMALIEQGTKIYNGIYKRVHSSITKEAELIKKLNAKYLDIQDYKAMIDDNVSIDDFSDKSIDYIPVSDPDMSSDIQRMAAANFLMPFLQDPMVNPIEIRRRILSGAKIEGVDALLQAPPPQQPPPDPKVQLQAAKLQQDGQISQQQLMLEMKRLELDMHRLELQQREADAAMHKGRVDAAVNAAQGIGGLYDTQNNKQSVS